MTIREQLEDLGLTPEQIEKIEGIVEREVEAEAIPKAGELLRRIFIRLDRDSTHGRAVARALGMTSHVSFERAAAAFCVSKQALQQLQEVAEAKLCGLTDGPPGGQKVGENPQTRFVKKRGSFP